MFDEKYYTHCFLCGNEWGAGNLYVIDKVVHRGKFLCNVFLCLDCAEKEGIIGENNEKN